ncbi:MAG: S-layer homology domain-containing protein [Acidimicrobiia bacterium]|nr:S-layer homology domain-containing protein [Acidimicrobiia bacterium]
MATTLLVLAATAGSALAHEGHHPTTPPSPSPTPIPEVDFTDVTSTHPFGEEIHWMAGSGYLLGYPDGTFRATLPISRQALAVLLWRMEGSPGGPFPAPPATDVPPDHPFFDAIAWAYSEGMVQGYADGTFRPGASVSRQAMVVVLHRLAAMEGRTYASRFLDIPAGHRFHGELAWGSATGLARGYDDRTFRPTVAVSRQAVAAWIHRFADMTGGVWPVPAHDHHAHHCHDPITPQQQAAADQLVEDVTEYLEENLATVNDAIAAGYVMIAPPFGGAGAHWLNVEYFTDGIVLDPARPESLMYASDGTVEGAMFLMESVGDPGPMIGGCLTVWHSHDNLCYTAPPAEGGSVIGFTDMGAGCWPPSMLRVTPEMLHVWVIDHPGGPFAGLET